MAEESGKMYKLVDSKFKMHSFLSEIADNVVLFQVLQMTDSLMIFINYRNDRCLTDLSVAVQHANASISTKLIGDFVSEGSEKLASKVSKKLNKQVYVSYNIDSDRFTTLAVEKDLFREINSSLDKF